MLDDLAANLAFAMRHHRTRTGAAGNRDTRRDTPASDDRGNRTTPLIRAKFIPWDME